MFDSYNFFCFVIVALVDSAVVSSTQEFKHVVREPGCDLLVGLQIDGGVHLANRLFYFIFAVISISTEHKTSKYKSFY